MKRILAATIFLAAMQTSAFAADLVELGPMPLARQGIAAYQHGDYAGAVKFLSARARIQPADPNAYYYLGNAYLQLKQNDEAAHAFSACVKASPTSQAGQYSLQALETLSTMPRGGGDADKKKTDDALTPEQIEASKDALQRERALDKDFNEAVQRIKNERVALKRRIDQIYERLQDEISQMNRRSTPNFYAELAKTKSQAEIEVEQLQKKQQRRESRLLAPDKIDVRAVPQLTQKQDDSKNALGSLAEYFKPEKSADPLGTDVTPELTAKFMTQRDVFGDLATYQTQSRKLAKQMFVQLKSGIEMKQDSFDSQVHNEKDRLIRDLYSIQANYPNQVPGRSTLNPLSYLSTSTIPRGGQDNLSQMEVDMSQAAERTKKRMKDLQDGYTRDVDSLISGTKERLGSLIGQTATINSQMKNPKGTVQVVPLGTTLHTKNYVNFGDRDAAKTK